MKNLLALLMAALLAVFLPSQANAQASQLIGNATVSGTMTFQSGANDTHASGSTMTFAIAGTTNSLLYITNSSGNVGALGLGAGLSVSGGNLVAGTSTSHNPTAKVGATAVNGSASTFMTSDSAPAIDLTFTPTWTGLHTFSITSAITSGSDYGLEITPTLNQRNATNFTALLINETVTQAGTGNQYLLDMQVGGTSEFTVTSTGVVSSGTWRGAAVGSVYGGTGFATTTVGSLLEGTTSNGWQQLASGTSGYVLTANGAASNLAWQPLTSDFDAAFSSTQGAVIYRNATSWVALSPGTAGQVLSTGGASANVSWITPSAGPGTTTTHDVASYSNTTGALEDLGTVSMASSQLTVTENYNGSVGALYVDNTSNSNNVYTAAFLSPSIGGGNKNYILFGVNSTGNNEAALDYYYASSNSSNNYLGLGFINANDVVQIFNSGQVLINNGATPAAATGELIVGNSNYTPGNTGNTHGSGLTVSRFTYALGSSPPSQYSAVAINNPNYSGSGTVTTAASLWVVAAPTSSGPTITNSYAIYVQAGACYFGAAGVTLGSIIDNESAQIGHYPNCTYTSKVSAAVNGTVPISISGTTYYVCVSTAQ